MPNVIRRLECLLFLDKPHRHPIGPKVVENTKKIRSERDRPYIISAKGVRHPIETIGTHVAHTAVAFAHTSSWQKNGVTVGANNSVPFERVVPSQNAIFLEFVGLRVSGQMCAKSPDSL